MEGSSVLEADTAMVLFDELLELFVLELLAVTFDVIDVESEVF